MVIDWVVPDMRLDAAFGDGATRLERLRPNLNALAGVALILWYGAVTPSLHWQWWRYLDAIARVYDLVGGVVANGLDSVQRGAGVARGGEVAGRCEVQFLLSRWIDGLAMVLV